jgi:hypothetical protein
VDRYRATPPAIANTDGDPMCLISAAIAVEEGTVGKLATRPDFDRDSDEPAAHPPSTYSAKSAATR